MSVFEYTRRYYMSMSDQEKAEEFLRTLRNESGNTDSGVCPACGSGAWDTDALDTALFGFCHDCGFDLNTELSFSVVKESSCP